MPATYKTFEAGPLSTIDAAAFDTSGKLLALGGWGHGCVLRTDTLEPIWEGGLLGEGVHYEDQGVMRVVAVSPSGTAVFFGGGGHTGGSGSDGYFLLDLQTKQDRELLPDPSTACTAASFDASGQRLLALTCFGLLVFDLATGAHRSIDLPRGAVPSVHDSALEWLSADVVLVAAKEHLLEVDVRTEQVRAIQHQAGAFARLSTALPGGAALLTTPPYGAQKLWRYDNQRLVEILSTPHDIAWVAPGADQLFLIAHDDEGEARFLRKRLASGKLTKIALPEELAEELEGNLNPAVLAVSPDGRRMLLATDEDQTEEVFLVRLPRVALG